METHNEPKIDMETRLHKAEQPTGHMTFFCLAADGHAAAAGVEESELGQQACAHCGGQSQSTAF